MTDYISAKTQMLYNEKLKPIVEELRDACKENGAAVIIAVEFPDQPHILTLNKSDEHRGDFNFFAAGIILHDGLQNAIYPLAMEYLKKMQEDRLNSLPTTPPEVAG